MIRPRDNNRTLGTPVRCLKWTSLRCVFGEDPYSNALNNSASSLPGVVRPKLVWRATKMAFCVNALGRRHFDTMVRSLAV